ncbi:hypothetical protein GEOBRER4_n2071 [Citrifermentans bremense]|uniref:Uncharacterized protein n=1 Tax=Citrifermentans bremense TaxID=60035 RepID=A0A6S6M6C2_9BACT|nr:hypothetical protein [Citrifermentans bremense]BCG47244.1 hypothetical protein GEOBRER4_n2071 [Citrifermentans bremense]
MHATDPEEALVPLFVKAKDLKGFEQVGTGIFVDFQSQPFLFTAAHVADFLDSRELFMPADGEMQAIDGYVGYIDLLPGMNRSEDNVDIAYYRLSTDFARRVCANFYPLPQERCMLIQSALDLRVCSVYGYPVSKAKRMGGKYYSETATFTGIVASKDTYNTLGLSPDSSIIIHFDKKRAVSPDDGKKINPVSPRGMSGGGIFSWPAGSELSRNWSLPQLVGIFHTYKRTEGLLIGTHLLPVVAATHLGKMKNFGGVI